MDVKKSIFFFKAILIFRLFQDVIYIYQCEYITKERGTMREFKTNSTVQDENKEYIIIRFQAVKDRG